LQLNQPDHDAFRRFVEAAKSIHVTSPFMLSSLKSSVRRHTIFTDRATLVKDAPALNE